MRTLLFGSFLELTLLNFFFTMGFFSTYAQTCYDIQGWDIPFDIAYDDDNNLMLAGRTDGGMLFLRISLSGETLAQKAIPFVQYPDSYSIVEADEDSYLLLGADYEYGEPGNHLPFLIKVDSMGNELWRRTFTSASELEPLPIARHLVRNSQQEAVYMATKDTLWMISYEGEVLANVAAEDILPNPYRAFDLLETENGLALFCPLANSIYYFDENLNYQGGLSYDVSFRNILSIYPLPGGGFLLAGQEGDDLQWKMVKIDETGNSLWERSYSFPNYSWGYPKDIEAYDDGFLIVGSLAKIEPYGFCPVMMKITDDGSPKWLKEVSECNTNNAVEAFAIHPDFDQIHIAGKKYCPANSTNLDVFVDLTNTNPTILLSNEEDAVEEQLLLFPNPAGSQVNIVLPADSPMTPWQLSLYDTSGKMTMECDGTTPSFRLDSSIIPPGLYFLRIRRGNKLFQQRLVVE